VDSRHISKHRNDVLRLSQLLSPDDRIEAADTIRADIERSCREVFPEISEQLLGQLEVMEMPDVLMGRMRSCFGVDA
jgi:hypothetical protein